MSSTRIRRGSAVGLGMAAFMVAGAIAAAPGAAADVDTVAPSVPQNLRSVSSFAGNPVLSWDASSDNSGSVYHYWVLVDGQQRARPAGTTYKIQTLVDLCRITKGPHRITIQAVDRSLNRSAPSAPIDIVVV
jgi:hypothetical protein